MFDFAEFKIKVIFSFKICDPLSFLYPVKLIKEGIKLSRIRITSLNVKLIRSENHYSNWLDAIKNGGTPICDVETGHRSASICHLSNIAYKLNRSLNWNPEKEKFSKDAEANKLRSRKERKFSMV